MTKTGSTKNRMLNIIASGNKTLSDISRELELAPSTVSQHIQELRDMGAILVVDNPHIKKWKYYRLNPDFDFEGSGIGHGIDRRKIKIPNRTFYYIIGLGIIAAVAYSAFMFGGIGRSGNLALSSHGIALVPVSLTDPPHVPAGTSSLVISYSSLALHVSKGANSSWVESNASGNIDLMSLVNASQVVAGVSIPINSVINQVRLNISSAKITINGTTFNISLPQDEIDAIVVGMDKLNSTTGILLDLSPTIVTLYTSNSTVFVMVPSARAIITNGIANGTGNSVKGAYKRLDTYEVDALEQMRSNITISAASIVPSNGTLRLSITVKNSGKEMLMVNNLFVEGNQTPLFIYGKLPCLQRQAGVGVASDIFLCPVPGTPAASHGSVESKTSVQTNMPPALPIPYTAAAAAGNLSGVVGLRSTAGAVTAASSNAGIGSSVASIASNAAWATRNIRFEASGYGNYTTAVMDFSPNPKASQNTEFPIFLQLPGSNFSLSEFSNVSINGTAFYAFATPPPAGSEAALELESNANVHAALLSAIAPTRSLDFLILKNGTIVLANGMYGGTKGAALAYNGIGYALQPGQSVTLTYNAPARIADDVGISLAPGGEYRIIVSGSLGVRTAKNVTAG